MLQLHSAISYSFVVAGHTKFCPDCCFGIIKRAYKVNYISSLYEFAMMVKTSSTSGKNKAQLAGTHDRRVIVPVHNWTVFLKQFFIRVLNIKKYHLLDFLKMSLVKFILRTSTCLLNTESLMLLKNRATLPPHSVLPPIIHPEGLTQERKQYLYWEIRQFCKPGTENLVAPAP